VEEGLLVIFIILHAVIFFMTVKGSQSPGKLTEKVFFINTNKCSEHSL